MCPPFSFITNATRFGIESTSVEQIFGDFIVMVPGTMVLIIATISFSIVEQSTLQILLLIIAHKFSIGLRSGEFPGQSIVVSPFSSKNARIFFEVWQGARSCWKIPSPSGKSLCKTGSK